MKHLQRMSSDAETTKQAPCMDRNNSFIRCHPQGVCPKLLSSNIGQNSVVRCETASGEDEKRAASTQNTTRNTRPAAGSEGWPRDCSVSSAVTRDVVATPLMIWDGVATHSATERVTRTYASSREIIFAPLKTPAFVHLN